MTGYRIIPPVPISAEALPLPDGAATSSNQTNGSQKTILVDAFGNSITSTNIGDIGRSLNILSVPYYQALAEGAISGHTRWEKLGHSSALQANTETDLWAAGGVYTFPTSASQWEVVSSDNTNDIGTIIKSGTSTGGSTTTLIDTGVDFTAATAAAVGDCVILSKSGTTPEWGYVTSVSTNTLTLSGGFSSGGTGALRNYVVVDKSATTGAQAAIIEYLDSSYLTKYEICILNGTTAVATVNTNFFRVNSFRLMATGSTGKSVGNITLRGASAGTTFSYIPANLNRARNSIYTIPSGKTLYITQAYYAFGYIAQQTEYCTFYLRANSFPGSGFLTDGIFYTESQAISQNASVICSYTVSLYFREKTDIKISALATATGSGQSLLRGFLE